MTLCQQFAKKCRGLAMRSRTKSWEVWNFPNECREDGWTGKISLGLGLGVGWGARREEMPIMRHGK